MPFIKNWRSYLHIIKRVSYWFKFIYILFAKQYMRNLNQRKQQFELGKEAGSNPERPQKNKLTQQYHSYFYRNNKEPSEQSPCQTSKTNKQTQGKSRLKSTRVKSKNSKCIYYELESTKKHQIETLREQNSELKRTIAQLKISQLYQIDESKIKSMLMNIQELNSLVKKLQRQNQKLRIENDFLNRSNTQMKLELNRMRKKEISNELKQDVFQKNPYMMEFEKNKLTPRSSMQIPEYLFYCNKKQNSTNIQELKMRKSYTGLQTEGLENISIGRQKQLSYVKMSSEKYINPRLMNGERRKSKKKNIFTEGENNQTELK